MVVVSLFIMVVNPMVTWVMASMIRLLVGVMTPGVLWALMPVKLNVMSWLVIGKQLLLIVMLDSVLGACLNVVEELVILVLNISNDCLTVVELNIMRVGVLIMVKGLLPVSVSFVVSSGAEHWLVDLVVGVEMSIALESVIIMAWTDWSEFVTV